MWQRKSLRTPSSFETMVWIRHDCDMTRKLWKYFIWSETYLPAQKQKDTSSKGEFSLCEDERETRRILSVGLVSRQERNVYCLGRKTPLVGHFPSWSITVASPPRARNCRSCSFPKKMERQTNLFGQQAHILWTYLLIKKRSCTRWDFCMILGRSLAFCWALQTNLLCWQQTSWKTFLLRRQNWNQLDLFFSSWSTWPFLAWNAVLNNSADFDKPKIECTLERRVLFFLFSRLRRENQDYNVSYRFICTRCASFSASFLFKQLLFWCPSPLDYGSRSTDQAWQGRNRNCVAFTSVHCRNKTVRSSLGLKSPYFLSRSRFTIENRFIHTRKHSDCESTMASRCSLNKHQTNQIHTT